MYCSIPNSFQQIPERNPERKHLRLTQELALLEKQVQELEKEKQSET